MAGHSKWANIKHRKAAQDKKRSKRFTRILKELQVAVKHGLPDPESNPALRLAIQNAKGAGIPKDTVERVIAKAQGKDAQDLTLTTYECYALGGVGLVVETMTDNANRTIANLRATLGKMGGSLGTTGSLRFIFEQKGVFEIPKPAETSAEKVELELIEGGAEDIEKFEDHWEVITAFTDFGSMQKGIEQLEVEAISAEVQWIPNTYKSLSHDEGVKVLKLIEKLEEEDDVSRVFHNLEMKEELVAGDW